MLTIRDSQFTAFRQAAADAFAEKALKHLLLHYPEPSAALGGAGEVRAFVLRGIQRAAQSGVDTDGAVTALLELWIQFGEHFERSPLRAWAANILSHPTLPGTVKAEVIRDRHIELTGGCVLVSY